jgi:hypothetical protein
MPATYTLISSNVLTSTAASVTFSAIPATYTDLEIRISSRSNNSAVSQNVNMTLNGLGTSVYSYTLLSGNGSAASSARASSTTDTNPTDNPAATATASTFSNAVIYIPSYTASQNKPMSSFGVRENNTTAAGILTSAMLFSSTAAITSITISSSGGSTSFVADSSFYLYGISNA